MKQSTTISISIHTDGKVIEGSSVKIAEVNILEPLRKYAYKILIPLNNSPLSCWSALFHRRILICPLLQIGMLVAN